ncbi:MAG: carboxypeptidase-like regulatory domain-containing protein [Candidatus Sulfotelmatobacter sp.]
MDHFSEQAWADFARGFSEAGKAPNIQTHLAASCLECKAVEGFWRRMQTMALAEAAYAPPEDLVRLVKLEFAAKQETRSEKWSLASLLFDSIAQPLPAGVRSGDASVRQVVYEAEGLTVDLRFDRIVPSGGVSVVGQLLDNRVPRELLTGASIVVLTEDGDLVATTLTNGSGEFQLEFEPADHLRLTARVGRRRVQIPLANLK